MRPKTHRKPAVLKNHTKKIAQKLAHSKKTPYLCIAFKIKHDSLAQLVEHNTFNVGVLGSSPRRITNKSLKTRKIAENQAFSAIFILPIGDKNRHFWAQAEITVHLLKPVGYSVKKSGE